MRSLSQFLSKMITPKTGRVSRLDAELLEERILLSAVPLVDVGLFNSDSTDPSLLIHVDQQPNVAFGNTSDSTATISENTSQEQPIDTSSRLELVFVNSNTPDYLSILDDLLASRDGTRDFEVYLLDATRDGVQQISEILEGYDDVSAIHLVTHSEDGALQLGNTWLSSNLLPEYATQLVGWQSYLSGDADLLLYGCDLAKMEDGQALVDGLSILTGADAAASVDATGNANWGGDWELEYQVGSVESEVAFSVDFQSQWRGKLATITVTTFSDVVNGADGVLSLREAIIQSNSGGGGDTIVLSSGVYTLSRTGSGEDAASTGDLDLLKDVTIVGMGPSTIIDANGIDRVFHVIGADVSISKLEIRDGNSGALNGGAVLVESGATLTLEQVSLQSSTGQRGGGIYSDGSLTLQDVYFHGNTSTLSGGGLSLAGQTTMLNVTVSSNTASSGDGGGIALRSGLLNVVNSTISGNTSSVSGGGLHVLGNATLQNATITKNSSGVGSGVQVVSGGNVSTRNTIIANNVGSSDVGGAFTTLGNNLIGNAGSSTGFTVGGNNDQIGDGVTPIDPMLEALGYNGGFTPTHALKTGSTAINAGSIFGALLMDQRGISRTATPDIGSFESSVTTILNHTEQLVNNSSSGTQETSTSSRGSQHAVAVAADGSYVVVWSDDSIDANGWGVAARRYNADGTAIGSAFLVNTNETGDQRWAAVASDKSGRFVVAWTAEDGSNTGIYMRRFNSDGSAIDASDVLVNWQATSQNQSNPSIAMNNAGHIVIAWESIGGPDGIYAKLFDMTTVTAGNQIPTSIITVAANTGLSNAAVDLNEDGKFVVVWQDAVDTYGQRFSAAGVARGSAIDLSVLSNSRHASVAVQSTGAFVVAYRSDEIFFEGIYLRRFGDDGTSLGTSVKASTGTSHVSPALSMDSLGNVIVVYEGSGDGFGTGVFGRTYSSTLASITTQFQINESVNGNQNFASVAMSSTGNYVAVWSGNGDRPGNIDSTGVFSRQFGTMSAIAVTNSPTGTSDTYSLNEDSVLTTYADWFDSSWNIRRKITFNNLAGPNLDDQAILVTLDSSSIDYARTQDSGQDLRFVDGDGSLLAYEIDSWNESGTSYVWVNVPRIDATSSADFVWMYYGNSSASAGQNPGAVWLNGADAILHMGSSVADSTGQNVTTNNGTSLTSGFIGHARNFDGTDDTINLGSVGAIDDLFTGGGTVAAWIRPTGWGENNLGRIADKSSSTAGGNGWSLYLDGNDGSVVFEFGFSTTLGKWKTAASTVSLNAWQHIAVTYDSTSNVNNPKIFINGIEVSATEVSTPSGTPHSDAAQDLVIGNSSVDTSRTFAGSIDEVRAYDSSISAPQISAMYQSSTSTLVSLSTLQSGAAGVLANDVDLDTLSLSATLVGGPIHALSFVFNSNGTFTYQPAANYFGSDSFSYIANDGVNSSELVSVTLTIASMNEDVIITSNGGVSSVTLTQSENLSSVGTISASDADTPSQTLTFSISGGDDQSLFFINSSSGVLTFLAAPNFEAASDSDNNNVYVVEVSVSDGNGSTDSQTFTINVTDANEFAVSNPLDANNAANSVNENAAVGSTVGITATSSDTDGTNNSVSYSLTNSASGKFAIDANSGVVTVASSSLNRESSASHTITVRATSTDGSTSDTTFTIAILDVDEFDVSAILDSTSSANSISEGAANGSAVGLTASASDADATNNSITYSLVLDAGGRFAIDANSGLVTVANGSLLDFESSALHSITVQATSSDGSSSTHVFVISVSNVNETGASAIADGDTSSNTVMENASLGTTVGIVSVATDADTSDAITYSLDDDAVGRFTINATSGVVSVSGAINREASASYNIVVRATSSDSTFSTATFTIIVGDVNEFALSGITDTDSSTNAINENAANGTVVGLTAFASDADATNNSVTYTLSNSAGGRFTINSTTGQVSVASSTLLDFEASSSHSIVIVATSSDGSTSVGSFTIQVVNVNESSISGISDNLLALNVVAENASLGTTVGIVAVATDADTSDAITYGLDNDAGGRFTINAMLGVVSVSGATNREAIASHNIVVRATSSDSTFSTATFTIIVGDVNEFALSGITDTDATANVIDENAANGTVVGLTAFASDADATNNSVTYALSNSAGGRFAINSTTGQVSVAASTLLDFEASSSHGIVIVATSGDGSTSVGSFIIQVANVNEASVSAISDTSAAINEVAENSSAGATVGITAFATDSDGTDSVLYSLMDNAGGLFAIDSTTGVVTTTASLDRELSASYSILVTATSSDGSSSSHRFTIDIQDVDEVAPTLSSSAVITMPENVQFAGLLTATDADSSSVVTFSIIGGADQGLLEIVRGNELAFRIAPNFETPVDQNVDNQYEIMVRVSDSAGNYTDEAISIGVVNVNEAPIDSTLSLVAIEDTPLEVPISGILTGIVDPDGDALTVTIAMGATHGTVTLRTDGTLVYSASALFHGADSFVLEVNDGSGGIAQIFATVAVDAGFSGIQIIADADNSTSTTDTTDSSNSTDSVSESTSSQTSTSSDTASSDTKSQDSSTLQLTSNVQAPTTESGATSPNESETNGNSSLVATETARSNNARSDRSSASSAVLESIFEYRSVREFARQGSLRMEEQASFVTAQIYDLVQTQAVLWQDLDQIRENIVNGTNDSLPIPLGAATGVASSLSVGYVIWLLRSGYIVAGVMAQLPAWGLIDPLPILSQLDDLDDDDDDSLAALVDKSNAQEDAAIESRRLISTVEEFAE